MANIKNLKLNLKLIQLNQWVQTDFACGYVNHVMAMILLVEAIIRACAHISIDKVDDSLLMVGLRKNGG